MLTRFWAGLVLAAIPLAAGDLGKGDVFGQAGVYSELGAGGGTWPMAGGGAGANFGHIAAVFGEFDYAQPLAAQYGVGASGNVYQAGGGVRIYLPVRAGRLRPYICGAGGYLHGTAEATLYFSGIGAITLREAQNGGYAGAGFGADIFLTKRIGLRPEFRYAREFWGQGDDDNSLRVTFSVLYRFGAK